MGTLKRTAAAVAGVFLLAACGGAVEGHAAQSATDELPERQSEPSWSPDGTRIAFRGGAFPDVDLWVADADGANPRRLTRHAAADDYPAFSPDGRELAFLSYRDDVWKLYVMDADGSNVRELLTTSEGEQDPARPSWTPDAAEILVRIRGQGDTTRIVAVSPEGDSRTIPTPAGADWPSAVPDGSGFVFTAPDDDGVTQVWFATLDGDGLRQVTRGSSRTSLPRVMPDGQSVVHVTNETGGALGWEIYRTPLAGGDGVRLTSDDFWKFYPEPSPDGSSILFVTIREGMSGPVQLWRMASDGSAARPAFGSP